MNTRFATLCAIACMFHFSLSLEAQGNVGIGTNNPIHPFQVNVDSIDSAVQPDQSTGSQNGFLPIVSGLGAGQTIVVGLTGELYQVDLALNYTGMTSGTLRLKIRDGSTSSGTVLAQEDVNVTSSVSTVYPIMLTVPLPFVYAGDSLFFDVSHISGGNLAWRKNSLNPYAPGIAYIYTGTWSMLSGDDMIFTTHVNLLDTTSVPVLQVTQEGRLALKNYVLPEIDGEEGQVMVTDGNGDVAWIDGDTLLTGFWRIGGNSGTNPANNFLGTIDNQPLKFRIRNKNAGRIDSTNWNTAIGFRSMDSLTTGMSNTALGYLALLRAKTSEGNTAIGSRAMSGYLFGSIPAGDLNTAVGSYALSTNSNTGSYNTAIGSLAMFNHFSGSYNSAFGYYALDNGGGSFNVAIGASAASSCSGANNVAVGSSALYSNAGHANVAIGASALENNGAYFYPKSYLVALGDSALFNNGLGSTQNGEAIRNTAIGSKTLFANTTGSSNTAVGFNTLRANIQGGENTAIGVYALQANLTGSVNAAVGVGALYSNQSGSMNTAIGRSALYNNISGQGNVAIGHMSLYSVTMSNGLVAVGDSALHNNSGTENTAIGARAMVANMTGWVNTAVGSKALYVNTEGIGNTAVGANALLSNQTAGYNTAIGLNALQENVSGFNNTATGSAALQHNNSNYNSAYGMYGLYENTSGQQNTAIGYATLYSNESGNFNTALGSAALNYATGSNNTAIGAYAMYQHTSGSGNTAVGRWAMYNPLIGNNNTIVGHLSDITSVDEVTNGTTLGSSAHLNASNKVRIGNENVTVIEGQVDWSFPSDARFKFNIHSDAVPGLDFITQLRPVTYQFDTRKFKLHLMQHMPDSIQQRHMEGQDYTKSSARVQTGFLAQEVEEICNDLGYAFSGLHVPESDIDNYGLAYGSFVPLLVKAIQEQQSQITSLENTNQSLTDRITRLEMTVERLLRTED